MEIGSAYIYYSWKMESCNCFYNIYFNPLHHYWNLEFSLPLNNFEVHIYSIVNCHRTSDSMLV